MKIARFAVEGRVLEGAVRADGRLWADGRAYPAEAVTWLPPVVPGKAIGLALNYRDHAAELKLDLPPVPILFNKMPNTFIGHKGKIIARGTVAEIRAMGDSHDDHLTSVFPKLTGGSGLQEIDEIV